MTAKYSINENFFIVKPRQFNSWVWKCILRNRQQFHKEIRWKVGDGTNINFWLDSWCDNCCLVELMKVPDMSSIDNSLKVSKFILSSKEWDIAKLQGLFNHLCFQMILATPLPTNPIPDSIC